MRYRSRQTEVDAMLWDVNRHAASKQADTVQMQFAAENIVDWVNESGGEARYQPEDITFGGMHVDDHNARIAIKTVNGWAYAAPGHYIVRGDIDFYPCDPETFHRRWEPAS